MTAPEYDGSIRPPLPHGSRRGLDDPGTPTGKHRERHRGESYPDALSRVAGERDAALRDVDRLRARIVAVRAMCCQRQTESADGDMTDADTLWPSQVLDVLDAPPDVTR